MQARYLTDEVGKVVGVVVDPQEVAKLTHAYESVARATQMLEQYMREAREGAGTVEEHRLYVEALEEVAAVQRELGRVGEELEELEDREATAAFDRDMADIERGEAELIPREQSKARRRAIAYSSRERPTDALGKLPEDVQGRLDQAIDTLAQQPRPPG